MMSSSNGNGNPSWRGMLTTAIVIRGTLFGTIDGLDVSEANLIEM
jgi:hypothetical protein